jgi:hypothetical protein
VESIGGQDYGRRTVEEMKVRIVFVLAALLLAAGCENTTGGPRNGDAAILGFAIDGIDGVIRDKAITLYLDPDTERSALVPTITVSWKASLNPPSGLARDFGAGPLTWTVSAEDGTTNNYTVTVRSNDALRPYPFYTVQDMADYILNFEGPNDAENPVQIAMLCPLENLERPGAPLGGIVDDLSPNWVYYSLDLSACAGYQLGYPSEYGSRYSGPQNGEKLTRVVLPRTLEILGESLFDGCSSLRELVFPETLATLGFHVFRNCKSLRSVDLGKTEITEIPLYTFQNCSSLETFIAPPGLVSIGQHAFEGCSSLKEIVLPPTVRELGNSLFAGCVSLKTLTVLNSEPPLTGLNPATYGFLDQCPALEQVYVPPESLELYRGTWPWSIYRSLIFALPEEE